MEQISFSDLPIIFFEVKKAHLKSRKASSKESLSILSSNGYPKYQIEKEYPSGDLAIPAEKGSRLKRNAPTIAMANEYKRLKLYDGILS